MQYTELSHLYYPSNLHAFIYKGNVINENIIQHLQANNFQKETTLFAFLGNNVTPCNSKVEIGQAMTGIEGDKGLNFITTGHQRGSEPGGTHLLNGQLRNGYTIRELNHTHPLSLSRAILITDTKPRLVANTQK